MARPGAPDEDLGVDGRHRVVNSNLGPIRASNGSLAGAIHLAADVTAEVDAGHAASFTEIRSPEQDRWAAQRLQRALLPSKARHIAGVSAATRYLPSGADHLVGGDWWDLLDLGQDSFAFAVGDISGHGIDAAALMGQARAAVCTAARAGLSPAQILAVVDAQLAGAILDQDDGDIDLHRFATAVVAVSDPGRTQLRVASAGHLPLIVWPANGPARPLWAPRGPPLGLELGPYQEVTLALHPGDTVLAYTDGLAEDRQVGFGDGIDRLAGIVGAAAAEGDVEGLADAVLTRMERTPGPNEDDIALLVVRIDPGSGKT